MERLRDRLRRIDGRPYPAYKDLRGVYGFEDFELEVAHVQGDPFAAPSKLVVRIPLDLTNLHARDIEEASRRTGLEDALLRSFAAAMRRFGGGRRGSGKSGQWGLARPGQEMLPRSACEVRGGAVHLRLTVGLPAQGRRIRSRPAGVLFFEELPDMVDEGVFGVDPGLVKAHADAHEDQTRLRAILSQRGWVGFIADGAVLPRRSGVDDRPLGDGAVAWSSPPELRQAVELPHAGRVEGTPFERGVTLVCGGGYHGKSTVLRALSRAVYNHVPGDGRELCAATRDAVHVRAEDGRCVRAVDISSFIDNLPDGRSTARFDSENASGSTSQAANIVEAIEVGATCLLIDEDTSATNFMVRDRRMQALIATECEPITPFVDRVRGLSAECGVSTVLVVGGSGDYFEVADTVLVMEAYRPRLATEEALQIAARHPSGRLSEARRPLEVPTPRVPLRRGFDPSSGRRSERVRTRETRTITFGQEEIEVSALAQLIDDGQTRALGDWLLRVSRHLADDALTLSEVCDAMEEMVESDGLAAACASCAGDRALPRRHEFAAAINRLRSLEIL